MREFAAGLEQVGHYNPLPTRKLAPKLQEQVKKTKKNLSANNEAQLSVECLMEDQNEDFCSTISRDAFLEMCQPIMTRVNTVMEETIRTAAEVGITVEQIDFVEMLGGASRVPWVKECCQKAFGVKSLGSFQDEAVATGCALAEAQKLPLPTRPTIVNRRVRNLNGRQTMLYFGLGMDGEVEDPVFMSDLPEDA